MVDICVDSLVPNQITCGIWSRTSTDERRDPTGDRKTRGPDLHRCLGPTSESLLTRLVDVGDTCVDRALVLSVSL
jgi:hypothetical protein